MAPVRKWSGSINSCFSFHIYIRRCNSLYNYYLSFGPYKSKSFVCLEITPTFYNSSVSMLGGISTVHILRYEWIRKLLFMSQYGRIIKIYSVHLCHTILIMTNLWICTWMQWCRGFSIYVLLPYVIFLLPFFCYPLDWLWSVYSNKTCFKVHIFVQVAFDRKLCGTVWNGSKHVLIFSIRFSCLGRRSATQGRIFSHQVCIYCIYKEGFLSVWWCLVAKNPSLYDAAISYFTQCIAVCCFRCEFLYS